ncbi:hypothetical protein D9756_007355 [Leucocoprinus leucothites]|uniref:Uncharacterized protein n=1 Tax=Leucocoprinus leucothites TaxID=201217 RepID=A0A8H5D5I5_9AGAR|nr:hypothetical protein D9756_007355 [Leucoagaricus leucothites]
MIFINKLSMLDGNFTLGRVSAALARLGDLEVMQLIAGTVSNIVEGEILQMKDVIQPEMDDVKTQAQWHATKSEASRHMEYLPTENTASLMAKAACSAVLGGCTEGEIWKEVAYAYGRNIGIAFQLGLATAPALYAWEEFSEMGELIGRKFESSGDVEKACNLIHQSSAIPQTKQLAQAYTDEAKNVLQELPHSEACDVLEVLAECIVGRKK